MSVYFASEEEERERKTHLERHEFLRKERKEKG